MWQIIRTISVVVLGCLGMVYCVMELKELGRLAEEKEAARKFECQQPGYNKFIHDCYASARYTYRCKDHGRELYCKEIK